MVLAKNIRVFFVKLLGYLFVVIAFQGAIVLSFTKKNIPEQFLNFKKVLSNPPDILFLSDSTNCASDKLDSSKKSISDMLQDELPMYTIKHVSQAANNADLYYEYCRNIVRQEHKPKMIVMTINLRSFSASIDSKPGFQFEKEIYFLRHDSMLMRILYRPLSVFRVIKLNSISQNSFLQTPVFEGDTYAGKVKDFDNPNYNSNPTYGMVRNKMVYYYMYRLTPSTRKIRSVVNVIELLENNGIIPIFYVSPCQYDVGDAFVGMSFSENVAKNTGLIKSILTQHGLKLIDLSHTIRSQYFIVDARYPGEHLKESGRLFVAKKIADFIKD